MADSGAEPVRQAAAPAAGTLSRLERMLAASQDGYWERDLRSGRIWYSDSFRALFGLAGPALTGRSSDVVARVHPDDLGHLRAAYDQALRSRGDFDFEVRFLDMAQRWRWIRGSGRVWLDAAGEPASIGGVVSDVHRRKTVLRQREQTRMALEALVRERTAGLQAALALAEQRRLEAERAHAAKTRFLAHMSHEVRTPLNGVLGLVELAQRTATDPAQQRYLQVARQSGQALQQVISDVLDHARLEAGRPILPQHPFDLADALADVMRGLMPLARQRDLVMMYDWEGDNTWVQGNESAIRQIVTNLLGNALKFTDSGQVTLHTRAEPGDGGSLRLAVQVQDTGPGIAPALRQRVFEAFEQGDNSLSRVHGGTGLGLTIARGLAAALGGSLHLDCPAEGGSIFTLKLCLPAGPEPEPTPSVTGSPRAGPDTRPPDLVWLVYHRQAPADWLARRLQRLGWQVAVRVGVADALAHAQQPGGPWPDLVLLGEPVLTPDADLAALRRALPQVPMRVLIRPDWHDPVLEPLARSLDMRPLLAPLTPAALRALGRSLPPGPALGPAAAVSPLAAALRAGAQVLLVEDNAVNQMVAEACLQALGLQVSLADSGPAALAACVACPPALVLMDLQMPGMDGLETASRLLALQRQGRWPGAPIVALTAHAGPADLAACRAVGMSGVMSKPVSIDSLRQQLAQWLPA